MWIDIVGEKRGETARNEICEYNVDVKTALAERRSIISVDYLVYSTTEHLLWVMLKIKLSCKGKPQYV